MENRVSEHVPLLILDAGQSRGWHCGPSSCPPACDCPAEPGMPAALGTEEGWEGGDKSIERQNDNNCYFSMKIESDFHRE